MHRHWSYLLVRLSMRHFLLHDLHPRHYRHYYCCLDNKTTGDDGDSGDDDDDEVVFDCAVCRASVALLAGFQTHCLQTSQCRPAGDHRCNWDRRQSSRWSEERRDLYSSAELIQMQMQMQRKRNMRMMMQMMMQMQTWRGWEQKWWWM